MEEKRKLPTLAEIESGEGSVLKKENNLNALLAESPPEKWLKKHNGIPYLPIDKIEYLLTYIFVKWRVEIKSVQVIANSVAVSVRLYYLNPITNELDWQDGIGAAPMNTKKGSDAMDWNSIVHDSVQKATPAAKTFAIKDAAHLIGRLFGKDLTRRDLVSYDHIIDSDRFKDAEVTER